MNWSNSEPSESIFSMETLSLIWVPGGWASSSGSGISRQAMGPERIRRQHRSRQSVVFERKVVVMFLPLL